jgi:hypothetical protein
MVMVVSFHVSREIARGVYFYSRYDRCDRFTRITVFRVRYFAFPVAARREASSSG